MSNPKIEWTGCRVEAREDGALGWTVRVWTGDESLLAIHVPSPAKRHQSQFWNSVEWGGKLSRELYAAISKRDAKRLETERIPPPRAKTTQGITELVLKPKPTRTLIRVDRSKPVANRGR